MTEYRGSRLPIFTPNMDDKISASNKSSQMPINLQMLCSGFQFEPQLLEPFTFTPAHKIRTTSERLREYHDKTLEAVAKASRTRAHTTHTCSPQTTMARQAEAASEHGMHASATTFAPIGPTAAQQQEMVYGSEDKACLDEGVLPSSSRSKGTHGRSRMTHGLRLESRFVHKVPDGQHQPSTLINHLFLRSGAQFRQAHQRDPTLAVVGSNKDEQRAAAGDQNFATHHRSRNTRLEEFYKKTLPTANNKNHRT